MSTPAGQAAVRLFPAPDGQYDSLARPVLSTEVTLTAWVYFATATATATAVLRASGRAIHGGDWARGVDR